MSDHYEANTGGRTVREFKSAVMTEHTVDLNWLDVDSSTRTGLDVGVVLQYGETTVTTTCLYGEDITSSTTGAVGDKQIEVTKTEINSNQSAYTYRVPMYDENGELFEYEVSGLINGTSEESEYYRTKSNGSDSYDVNSSVYFLKRKDLEFSIEFCDEAHSSDDIRPDIVDIIKEFSLYDEYGDQQLVDLGGENCTIEYDSESGAYIISGATTAEGDEIRLSLSAEVSGNVCQVTISGLDEMTLQGKAKTYYLKKNIISNIDLKEITAGSADDYSGRNDDSYAVSIQNSDAYASITDKIYDGCQVGLLLSGETDIQQRSHGRTEALTQQERLLLKIILFRHLRSGDMPKTVKAAVMTIMPMSHRQA